MTLNTEDYTLENALLWGQFHQHYNRIETGRLRERVVHLILAIAELLPIISQIVSLFELIIVQTFISTNSRNIPRLEKKKVKRSIPSYLPPEVQLEKLLALKSPSLEEKERILILIADIYTPNPISKFDRYYPDMKNGDTFSINRNIPKHIRNMRELIWYSGEVESLSEPDRKDFRQLRDACTRIMSAHPRELSFQDTDIVRVIPLDAKSRNDSANLLGKTDDGRHVMIQNGIRGCVPCSAAMIVSDKIGNPIPPPYANLSDNNCIISIFEEYGLTYIYNTAKTLEGLNVHLVNYGPASIGVNNSIGAHKVVLDWITEEGVGMRDPFHGIAVVITKDALLRSTHGRMPRLLQAVKLKHQSR